MNLLQKILTGFLFLLFLSPLYAQKDGYIKDSMYTSKLKSALEKDFREGTCTPIEDLQAQLSRSGGNFMDRQQSSSGNLSPEQVYQKAHPAVLVLGKLYKQPQSDHDLLYQATAFVIDPDGLCVTNYHVFNKMYNGMVEEKAMGVMDVDGNYYPVREVISAKKEDDLVIFRIETGNKKLAYLPLEEEAAIGSAAHIISHPANNFYYFSSGHVTRKYWYDALNSRRMSVSAEFALGSSGGPILNSSGNVIGMVAATINIPDSRQVQMIAREIIPAAAIIQLNATQLQP